MPIESKPRVTELLKKKLNIYCKLIQKSALGEKKQKTFKLKLEAFQKKKKNISELFA